MRRFYPDFIFWFKKRDENKYAIVFVDPKGTEHALAYRKIDGYKRIFTDNGMPKVFNYKDAKVVVGPVFITDNINKVQDAYENYWASNPKHIFERAKELLRK